MEVIAAAASGLGGALTEQREKGVLRLVLRLPGIERT